MFLYQTHAVRWSAKSTFEATATFKDEGIDIAIKFTQEEAAELDALASRVYARHQLAISQNLLKPLETNFLPAPEVPFIEDADFSEAPSS